MRKCNVCGRRFRLLVKNRYEVVKSPVGLSCLTQGTVYYNAFDCPYCGCQNIVGVVEKVKVNDMENDAISENFIKGFKEFTEKMYEQGEAKRSEQNELQ